MAGSSDIDAGRRVGKYQILTRLSVGGMAELYLAYIPGPGGFRKFVALKQILPDVKADESFVKMFLDEARITASLQHSNIGQVFDLGEDDKSHELYLAMEFIAGQNLEQLIKRAAKKEFPIPVGFACRVIRDTCLGLHSAHHFKEPTTGQPMPVVHRDVSPKNVMITYAGQVKVIDFGIAKARGRLNRTQVGIVKGTSGYMSPEQVKNEPLDGRTDLFATAVMLHELLSGERLFTAPTDAQMMIKIVEGDIDPPTKNNPYVTEELSAVVMRALERDREARFPTGKDLAKAIEQACPDLFDDEQVADLMKELFEDKITLTRQLFEQANQEQSDREVMSSAVKGLTGEEAEGGTPRPRKATGPRSDPAKKAGGSSMRLPKVGDKAARAGSSQRGLGAASSQKSLKSIPKVEAKASNSKFTLAPVEAEPDDEGTVTAKKGKGGPVGEDTLPPRRASAAKLPAVAPKPTAPEPPPPAEATQSKGGGGGALGRILGVVVILGLLGAAGWAVTMGPLKEHAKKALASDAEPPPDTSAKPIAVKAGSGESDKPGWLRDREAQKVAERLEAERQKASEEASNDPERIRILAEIQAQLAQLDQLEEEQRKLKVEARQGKSSTEANSKKIDDLQKQIDDLKGALDQKQTKAGPKKAPPSAANPAAPDEVQVVKDAKSAKNAALGFLTLRTVNPSSAAIWDGETNLGSTPLVKVPLDVGVHKLMVVDGDAKHRMLSITIEAGKTFESKGLDVGSLPMMP